MCSISKITSHTTEKSTRNMCYTTPTRKRQKPSNSIESQGSSFWTLPPRHTQAGTSTALITPDFVSTQRELILFTDMDKKGNFQFRESWE